MAWFGTACAYLGVLAAPLPLAAPVVAQEARETALGIVFDRAGSRGPARRCTCCTARIRVFSNPNSATSWHPDVRGSARSDEHGLAQLVSPLLGVGLRLAVSVPDRQGSTRLTVSCPTGDGRVDIVVH